MVKNKQFAHKPVIETMINSAALALFSFGVSNITSGSYKGYFMILFGAGLEFLKYKGRQIKLW